MFLQPKLLSLFNCQRSNYQSTNQSLILRGLAGKSNFGGGERDRTDDPLRARQVLSQLSYTPKRRADGNGGPGWTRTSDLTIISRVL